jgi:hypothetical protein
MNDEPERGGVSDKNGGNIMKRNALKSGHQVTLQSPVVNICTKYVNMLKFCTVTIQCSYVFRMVQSWFGAESLSSLGLLAYFINSMEQATIFRS